MRWRGIEGLPAGRLRTDESWPSLQPGRSSSASTVRSWAALLFDGQCATVVGLLRCRRNWRCQRSSRKPSPVNIGRNATIRAATGPVQTRGRIGRAAGLAATDGSLLFFQPVFALRATQGGAGRPDRGVQRHRFMLRREGPQRAQRRAQEVLLCELRHRHARRPCTNDAMPRGGRQGPELLHAASEHAASALATETGGDTLWLGRKGEAAVNLRERGA